MKIHTTQNLGLLSADKYKSHSMYPERSEIAESGYRLGMQSDCVSFRGKKELVRLTKEALEKLKNTAGKENKWYDKILTSGVFDKALDLMGHEVFVQAAISCIICVLLRPLTIMALPNKKDKNDNKYAAAHSISSGLVGLASSLLISVPFSKGVKYAQKNLLVNLDKNILKRMFPNLDLNSIWKDESKGIRKPMGEWLDKAGNEFSNEYKNVMKVAKPKHTSLVSDETLKLLGGSKDDLSNIEAKNLFIKVSEEGLGENFFSLGYIDEEFLKEVFKDLDINSIKKDGKVINPLKWKKTDGTSFANDIKNDLYLSSYRETCESTPLYTGRTRVETKGKKETKYMGYQRNVKDGLGTEVTQEMLDADHANDIKYKLLGWLPDIISRPFVAASTIALLPIILKDVFHLQKTKKAVPVNNTAKAVA